MKKYLIDLSVLAALAALFIVTAGAFTPAGQALAAAASQPQPQPAPGGGIEAVLYEDLLFVPAAGGSSYLTEPLTAPFPFNAVVPEWESAGEILFEMRSGTSSGWGEWVPIAHNHDFVEEGDPREVGDMLLVPAVEVVHTQVQLRAWSDIGPLPRLTLTYIDTAAGPSTAEMLAQQAALDAQEGGAADAAVTLANPKPATISRGVWCTYPECSINSCMAGDPLKYEPVTHLIVHHTVTNNGAANWPAVVRAIFRYHALASGNCWGDIGYNYLIDMNGIIYEGHRGGDDVIGTHAAGGNRGSMGVSLIGLFTWPEEYAGGIRPPDPMLNSLINLLTWKADQKKINVYDGGWMKDLGGARPFLMGHRDVYGTTTCPGGQAHALLPWIRDQIAGRLPWLNNNYLYIDELSSSFTKYSQLRWSASRQCGYNSHAYYTWSTSDPGATPYWGEWRFNVPQSGLYEIQAFVPYCNTGEDETGSARYTIFHAGGASQATVDQQARVGRWTSLGTFSLANASDHRLRLTDITNDDGLGVWYDTIRLQRVIDYGRVELQSPSGDVWLTSNNVTFNWQFFQADMTPTGMDLRVGTDPGLTNVVKQVDLDAGVRQTTQSLPGGGTQFYWQVSALGTARVNSPVASFRIDTLPPTAAFSPLFKLLSGSYAISVDASDGESGIQSVDVQYRQVGHVTWLTLASGSPYRNFSFRPPDPTKAYEFRVSAVDLAGNRRPFTTGASATTADALLLDETMQLPVFAR